MSGTIAPTISTSSVRRQNGLMTWQPCGGDSIEAIQIQHAIHREFDLRVKNTEFLSEPTIAALARLIDVRRASSAPVANDAGIAVRA